ncbi:MAG: cation transporter [Thermotogota bacterium]|nr:cation transporter [Thermotogota bacterium]
MTTSNNDDILKKGEKVAWFATIATILLAVFKALVGFFSGSILLIADAVHSAVDTVAIFSSWFGLKISQKKYTEKFEKYVLDKLGKTNNSLWETERLKELKAMLDFTKTNNANWNNKTEYLPLAEFKKRKVLPKPSKV